MPGVPGDGGGADLHVSGDASDLLKLPAQVERVPRVSGALPGPAQETQVSGQYSIVTRIKCWIFNGSPLRINVPKYFYRYAERTADELKKLREELAELATPEI